MNDQHEEKQNASDEAATKERRKNERRQKECEGYCYIQMVGWMDRRERTRRDDDCVCD